MTRILKHTIFVKKSGKNDDFGQFFDVRRGVSRRCKMIERRSVVTKYEVRVRVDTEKIRCSKGLF